jgi:multicomponent Na+:H+ antiporter subunit E
MHNDSRFFSNHTLASLARGGLFRLAVFSFLWYALAGSDSLSWVIGIPAVLSVTVLSMMLASPSPLIIHPVGLLCFIPFFLYQSFRGGIDVMRRALSFRQRLNPGLISYTTLLPEGSARTLFVNTISLLPGTLSAELQGSEVTIHTLDQSMPVWANIQRLEYRIAALTCRTAGSNETL